MTEERIVSAKIGDDDDRVERAIRPHRLADYVGQAAVREQMGIAIEASRRRGDALDHVLIFGPPGLGKTTLAHILAEEMGVKLRQTRSEEHTSELQALMRNSYAVFCLNKKPTRNNHIFHTKIPKTHQQ